MDHEKLEHERLAEIEQAVAQLKAASTPEDFYNAAKLILGDRVRQAQPGRDMLDAVSDSEQVPGSWAIMGTENSVVAAMQNFSSELQKKATELLNIILRQEREQ